MKAAEENGQVAWCLSRLAEIAQGLAIALQKDPQRRITREEWRQMVGFLDGAARWATKQKEAPKKEKME